jgi:transcriptional regulator with XRE-family HTH domain
VRLTEEKRLHRVAVGLVIEDLRKQRGVSCVELQTLFGMSHNLLSRTLNGHRDLEFGEAQRITEVFEISLTKFGDLVKESLAQNKPSEAMRTQAFDQLLRSIPTFTQK